MQDIAVLPAEKEKSLTENKRWLNLSKHLGDEIALLKVNGIRQNIQLVFILLLGIMNPILETACWFKWHVPSYYSSVAAMWACGELPATRCLEEWFF